MLEWLANPWARWSDDLFMALVEPALQASGMASYLDDSYAATQWLLAGVLQVLAMACLLAPLERWRPLEQAPATGLGQRKRRQAVWVDVAYTLIDRLGLLRLLLFFVLDPFWNAVFGRLAVLGLDGWHLDQWMAPVWPGVTDTALAGFLAYAAVLDLLGYAVHRLQHRWAWWWALHAVHHSQRHMTVWTDSRSHLLDTVIVDSLFVLVARVIGMPPGQFMGLVALTKMVESLAHANLDWRWGRWADRWLVGPRFHRVHHGPGLGAASRDQRPRRDCNFAVLLPLWDRLFGTADFDTPAGATGIRDQWPEAGGHDYGQGFWSQQTLGLRRLWVALGRSPRS